MNRGSILSLHIMDFSSAPQNMMSSVHFEIDWPVNREFTRPGWQ